MSCLRASRLPVNTAHDRGVDASSMFFVVRETLQSDRQSASSEAPGGWARVPPKPRPRLVDEPADDDERRGSVEREHHYRSGPLGAPSSFAVLVHPGVGAFHHLPLARLERRGDALAQ